MSIHFSLCQEENTHNLPHSLEKIISQTSVSSFFLTSRLRHNSKKKHEHLNSNVQCIGSVTYVLLKVALTPSSGWKVVGEVKKVGKSRNFQPKVGKSRNFSVFKVGKIRNFYYNFSSFNLSINSKVFPFELFNYDNCL